MISFEESIEAITGAMLSSGTDLRSGLAAGTIYPLSAMPEAMGVEEHLLRILDAVNRMEPQHMVVDAISAASRMGSERSAFEFLVRLLNACRERGITVLLVNQTVGEAVAVEIAGQPISALVDTILFMRYVESSGEMNRVLSVVKSRGRAHSNQLREFRITSHGFEIAQIYSGEGTVLTGAAREEKQARDAADLRQIDALIEGKQREISRRKAEAAAEETRLQAAVEQAEIELRKMEIEREKAREAQQMRDRLRTTNGAVQGQRKDQ
jgi:circadian clock protein KaiC